jgi:GH25 family lysozyme M1 (1,4-beta-N-acetylmuramidase)
VTYRRGIDVSVVQGQSIDWQRVHNAGISFAWLKATEGLASSADPSFRGNVLRAKAAGVEVGAYHFCKVDLSPAMRTVQDDARGEVQRFAHFSDLLGSQPGELAPALDFEALRGMTPGHAAEWLMYAIGEVTKLWGVSPVIYTGRYGGKGEPLEPALTQVPEMAELQLWQSGYPIKAGRAITFVDAEAMADAKKPAPIKPWKAWSCWQFSGGGLGVPGNRVDGVPVLVDCNLLRA